MQISTVIMYSASALFGLVGYPIWLTVYLIVWTAVAMKQLGTVIDLAEYISIEGDKADQQLKWFNFLMFPDFKLEMFFLMAFVS